MKTKFTLLAIVLFTSTIVFSQNGRSWQPKETKQHFIAKMNMSPLATLPNQQATLPHLHKGNKQTYPQRKSATQALKYRLDSVVYDTLTSPGQWDTYGIDKFKYDWKGNNIKSVGYSVSGLAQVPEYEEQNSYNANNQQVESIQLYSYNPGSSSYDYGQKINTFYNTAGNREKFLYSTWNSMTQQFEVISKDSLIYNSNGDQTQRLFFNWNASQWEPTLKTDYTYDTNGNMSEYISYYWNSSTNQWEAIQKVLFTYNTSGYVTGQTSQFYNVGTSAWENDYKDEFTYDANGNMMDEISYDWDFIQAIWINAFKTTHTYDAQYNPIVFQDFYWNANLNQWVNDYKTDVTVENTVPISEVVASEGYLFMFNNQILSFASSLWNEVSNQWEDEERGTLYYDHTNSFGVAENTLKPLALYPNPASTQVHFSLKNQEDEVQVSITDLMGKVVLQTTQAANVPVQVSSLASGMYHVNIVQGKEHLSSKLMVN